MTNPLLRVEPLPAFDAIAPDHVAPAVERLLHDAEAALETVTAPGFPAEWAALSGVLDVATERLAVAWGAVSHLNSVADTPALRAAYNAALPQVTEFWTRLGADSRLYAKYKGMEVALLNTEQRQAHSNAMRNFVLGGAELVGAARTRFAEIQTRLADLSQKFSENALDATDAYAYYATAAEMDGIPSDVQSAAAAAARVGSKDGFKLTLKAPCYLPVMQFGRNRALRETLYRAFVTRASDQAPDELRGFDNTATIREILALRSEEAKLLGYSDYASLSLVTKMADSPDAVLEFLRDLARRARPFAEQDIADMRTHARAQLNLTDPQAWDWPFIGERLQETRYAFSAQDVKQYFPAPKVLAGLFKIIETLFDVAIRPSSAPVWETGVEFFQIERSGQPVAQFYLDATARAGKRSGAWMDDVRTRWLRPDTSALQLPVAHLVCNFAAGVDGKPALLTHRDVVTLFHEFGHGLHHMLTLVEERDVSGIEGVEWDAVELPSQFMENFCWEWSVLRHLTAHVDTGEALPRALFDKMLAARNFQSGLQTLRQVEFALFDMLLHTSQGPQGDFVALLETVRAEVAVVHPPAWNRAAQTFTHIFAGGYAAGYYSYKWAEVLSADAYAAFEETMDAHGNPSHETSAKYRREILEVGGSRGAMESFKAFRGRAPALDALLRHQGMSA